ncbi:MAG TPA: hypothetical protein VG650_03010 [Mycobacteriales bacterium]|nr:hypothetical protein [Mycobacteriales bacterium]
MSSKVRRSTRRWAATALVAGSMSAALVAPMATGTATATTTRAEKPILTVNDVRSGVVALHAMTNPALEHATIYFYELVKGEKRIVGYESTGPAGRAHVRVHVVPGSVHRYVAKWVRIHNYKFRASNPNVPSRSRWSNVVRHRAG